MPPLILSLDEEVQVAPVHVRIGHQAGHPDIVFGEKALNRLHFVDGAAEVRVLVPHPFFFRDLVLPGMRSDRFDIQAEELGQAILVFQGLREMKTGVDEVDRRSRTDLGQVIEQDRGTAAEARSDEHPVEPLKDVVDPLFIAQRPVLAVEGFELLCSYFFCLLDHSGRALILPASVQKASR